MPTNHLPTLRRRLSVMFNDDPLAGRAARTFNVALASLIVANVGAIIAESVEPFGTRYAVAFDRFEWAVTALFAIEYLLRLWTAIDLNEPRFADPLWGRLRYLVSFAAVIDLVAILPAILGLIGAADLRVLRLLRLLRMLKLTRHAVIFNLLWAVFREEARSLAAVLFLLVLTLTMSGALMYMIERDAQPTLFSSIPAAMWSAIETLTTVGYGDMVPTTAAGRVLGGIVSVIGVAALALFTGLITVSFMEQLKIRRALLQRAVDDRLLRGRLADTDLRAFALIGERLGLAESEISAAVLGAIAEMSPLACPQCGHLIAGQGLPPSSPSKSGVFGK